MSNATRWALISNTTVAPLVAPLKKELAAMQFAPEVFLAQYGEATQQILQPTSPLYAFNPDVVALYLDLDQLRPDLEATLAFEPPAERAESMAALRHEVTSLVAAIRSHSTATILVNNFPVPPRTALGLGLDAAYKAAIRQSNLQLADALAAVPNCYLYDCDSLWAEVGWGDRDRRFEMLAQLPFGPKLQRALIREWLRYFSALRGRTRKVVVVDLDNTLWGGILGEDGPDGIQMGDTPPGRPHRRLQTVLKTLARRGVLLAVCSKNNVDDVLPVLRDHPDQLLREADFAAMQINWTDKATNIRAIAAELNLGLQSFVFLDDNPAERQWVRQSLPEVLVPELPADAANYADVLTDSELDALTLTEEDLKRSEMYAVDRERRKFQATATDYEQFLRDLELVVRIERLTPALLDRATQLCQRTNQFNLTTRRHTAADLERMAASPDSTVLLMNVRDRFGEYGWTGLGIARRSGTAAEIDSFLVSCRILGKRVEQALFAELAGWAGRAGCVELSAAYLATKKNAMCATFYAECGMQTVPGQAGAYRSPLADLPALKLEHIDLSTNS